MLRSIAALLKGSCGVLVGFLLFVASFIIPSMESNRTLQTKQVWVALNPSTLKPYTLIPKTLHPDSEPLNPVSVFRTWTRHPRRAQGGGVEFHCLVWNGLSWLEWNRPQSGGCLELRFGVEPTSVWRTCWVRVWGRRLGFKVRSFRELPIVSIVLPFWFNQIYD